MSDLVKIVRLFREMEDDLGDWEDWLIAIAAVAFVFLWIAGVVFHWW